jgi:hypothetical protein
MFGSEHALRQNRRAIGIAAEDELVVDSAAGDGRGLRLAVDHGSAGRDERGGQQAFSHFSSFSRQLNRFLNSLGDRVAGVEPKASPQ